VKIKLMQSGQERVQSKRRNPKSLASSTSPVASDGSPSKMFAAARKLYNPESGAGDYRAGFELLKRAAALGSVDANEWLGAAYDYGLGTRPNRRRALEHYKIAADEGSPNSEYHVGVFYLQGIAAPRDLTLAVFWLRRAAKHGDATALYMLGECYRRGRGAPKDQSKGFRMEMKAARAGVVDAQYSVALCYAKMQRFLSVGFLMDSAMTPNI